MRFPVAHILPVPAPYVLESMGLPGVMATVNGQVTFASHGQKKMPKFFCLLEEVKLEMELIPGI